MSGTRYLQIQGLVTLANDGGKSAEFVTCDTEWTAKSDTMSKGYYFPQEVIADGNIMPQATCEKQRESWLKVDVDVYIEDHSYDLSWKGVKCHFFELTRF